MPEKNNEYETRMAAEQAMRDKKYKSDFEASVAIAIGGRRALQLYTRERFIVNDMNRAAFNAAELFDRKKENLYFKGPIGSGKSHLAAIACRRHILSYGIRDEGKLDPREVETTNPIEISRWMRMSKDAEEEQDRVTDYKYKPILVIDDLGVAKDTEFSISLLYEIIHARYMNRPGGLIITSNLGLGELASKLGDDRISSRLASMCAVFSLDGEKDYRLKQ